jgi:hypothetical protein
MDAKNQTAVHDPLTQDAWALFGAVRLVATELSKATQSDLSQHSPLKTNVTAKLSGELHQLVREERLFIIRFNTACASARSLGYLLSNREQAEGLIQTLQQSLELLDADEVALVVPNFQADLAEVLRKAFDHLYGRLKLVTPSHLALNSHFRKLIAVLETYTMKDEEWEFFKPLAKLRDEYFKSPSEAKLREYIQLSEAVVTSDRYRLYLIERAIGGTIDTQTSHRRELDVLANELEVVCLTEVLNSDAIVLAR